MLENRGFSFKVCKKSVQIKFHIVVQSTIVNKLSCKDYSVKLQQKN